MEASEHIVESFVRFVKGWFTITNIKGSQNKEIDILAVEPNSNNRYHIEVSVHITGQFQYLHTSYYKDKDKSGWKRHINFFYERFKDNRVKDKLKEYGFTDTNHTKIIVTWDISDTEGILEKNQDKHIPCWKVKNKNILIWKMPDILKYFTEKTMDTKYQTDDILRTIQLINLAKDK